MIWKSTLPPVVIFIAEVNLVTKRAYYIGKVVFMGHGEKRAVTNQNQ
jgi:hypothetical protein